MLLAVFGSMFFLLIVGVPIAVSIGVSSMVFSLWIPGGIDRAMILVAQMVNDNYTSPSTTITLPQTGTRRNYRSGALETRFCACFPDILSA